jgi:putative flippase GtrA
MKRAIRRFTRYSIIGGSTFGLDILGLLILHNWLGLAPGLAAGISFLVFISVNYALSYVYVFPRGRRSPATTYTLFITAAIAGAFLTGHGVAFAHDTLGLPLYIARVAVAPFVGTLNYLFNLYVNFGGAQSFKADD